MNRTTVASELVKLAKELTAKPMKAEHRRNSKMLVEVVISYDDEAKTKSGNEPEHEAQYAFINELPDVISGPVARSVKAHIESIRVVGGLIGEQGEPVGPRAQ